MVAAMLTYVAIKTLYELNEYKVKRETMDDPLDVRMAELVFLHRTQMKLVVVPTLANRASDVWTHVNTLVSVLFPPAITLSGRRRGRHAEKT